MWVLKVVLGVKLPDLTKEGITRSIDKRRIEGEGLKQ